MFDNQGREQRGADGAPTNLSEAARCAATANPPAMRDAMPVGTSFCAHESATSGMQRCSKFSECNSRGDLRATRTILKHEARCRAARMVRGVNRGQPNAIYRVGQGIVRRTAQRSTDWRLRGVWEFTDAATMHFAVAVIRRACKFIGIEQRMLA